MTVYVDRLRSWGETVGYHGQHASQAARVGARHGHRWCHMFADEASADELHALARKVGLRREWFDRDHYDLVPTKRAKVIAAGAVELSDMAAAEIWRRQRAAAREVCRG